MNIIKKIKLLKKIFEARKKTKQYARGQAVDWRDERAPDILNEIKDFLCLWRDNSGKSY